jgi:hypothetical protein
LAINRHKANNALWITDNRFGFSRAISDPELNSDDSINSGLKSSGFNPHIVG